MINDGYDERIFPLIHKHIQCMLYILKMEATARLNAFAKAPYDSNEISCFHFIR